MTRCRKSVQLVCSKQFYWSDPAPVQSAKMLPFVSQWLTIKLVVTASIYFFRLLPHLLKWQTAVDCKEAKNTSWKQFIVKVPVLFSYRLCLTIIFFLKEFYSTNCHKDGSLKYPFPHHLSLNSPAPFLFMLARSHLRCWWITLVFMLMTIATYNMYGCN